MAEDDSNSETRANQAAAALNQVNQPDANEGAFEEFWRFVKRYQKDFLLYIMGFSCLVLIVGLVVVIFANHKIEDNKPPTIQVDSARYTYESNSRLDKNVVPVHYEITLSPDFETFLFNGSVKINLSIQNSTNHIRLHAKYLNVTSYSLFTEDKSNNTEIEIKVFVYYMLNEYIILEPKNEIPSGKYELFINYWGNLTKNGDVGLYKSTYLDKKSNTTKMLVTTNFQPTYARQCFPGFDEPSFKSTFSIKVVRPSHLTALSNMPIKNITENYLNTNTSMVEFGLTPPMATNLVKVLIKESKKNNKSSNVKKKPIKPKSSQDDSINDSKSEIFLIGQSFGKNTGIKYLGTGRFQECSTNSKDVDKCVKKMISSVKYPTT